MALKRKNRVHHGGHLGLFALLCMLSATSCVAMAERGGPESAGFLPSWTAVAKDGPPAAIPAQLVTEEASEPVATFIVKFKPDPVLKAISQTFRRDTPGARLKFKAWANQHDELKGLQLLRASYSGDLVIALPAGAEAGRKPGDIIAALNAMDNCIYAELDEIAMPGQED